MGGSLISEGATLLVAVNTIRHDAKQSKMTFKEYGSFFFYKYSINIKFNEIVSFSNWQLFEGKIHV